MKKLGGDIPWETLSVFSGPHHSPGFMLWRGFMEWQRQLNSQLRPLDLTQPQFAILAVCAWLNREGITTQLDVAAFTGMDRMHISQIVSRLEECGLLSRHPLEGDKRAKVVQLTEPGRAKLTQALPLVEAFDKAFFATVGGPGATAS